MIQFPGGEGKFPGKREVIFDPKSRIPGLFGPYPIKKAPEIFQHCSVNLKLGPNWYH